MLYGKLRIDFLSASELLYSKMKVGLQLFIAEPIFYVNSDNHNVSLGIFDCSIYTRGFTLND